LRWLLGVTAVAIFIPVGASSAFAEVTGAADNLRTGWYPDEPGLTQSLLKGGTFKEVFKHQLKGQIYAQPLIANGMLLVATEENWVYGLDPNTGEVRWEKPFGTSVTAGEKNPKEEPTIQCTDLQPRVGITGTPVIDTEHGIAYFVANQYVSGSSGSIAWFMHAVSLATGNEIAGFPVEIKGKGQNLPNETFEPVQQLQRPALLMMNGVVYAGFGSHCDNFPYEGWLVGVTTSGQLQTMWATANEGGSIWQAGGGLISDAPGQILFSTGNGNSGVAEDDPPAGAGGANTPASGLGQSVVRVEVKSGGVVKPTDFFSPFENLAEDKEDLDLGASAPIALPSPYFGTKEIPHLLVQSGKSGYVYLLNRDNLGGMGQGEGGHDKVLQRLGPYGGVWDGSAVWPGDGGYVYIPSVELLEDNLRYFKYEVNGAGEPALSLAATSSDNFAFGSGAPIVTSNGATSGTGILWITWCSNQFSNCKEAKLRAYNPVPVGGVPQVLWEAPIGQASKFSRPDASNGHIYVGNHEGDIYGFARPESEEERKAREKAEQEAKEKGERESKEKAEREAREKAEQEAKEKGERESKEKAEREAREKAEREAKERAEPTGTSGIATPASFVTPPTGPTTVTTKSPPSLTKLKIRASASRLRSRLRKLVVTYSLSAAAEVEVAIYRRVISHSCQRGASSCVRWVRTKIKLKLAGHTGSNVLAVNLGRLSAGDYRMGAMPITLSGAPGITQYVHFKAFG
jgi:outer membrane protein assembly factor BamB